MGYTRLVAIAALTVILLVSSPNPHPLTWRRPPTPTLSRGETVNQTFHTVNNKSERLRTVYYAILFLPLLLEDIY